MQSIGLWNVRRFQRWVASDSLPTVLMFDSHNALKEFRHFRCTVVLQSRHFWLCPCKQCQLQLGEGTKTVQELCIESASLWTDQAMNPAQWLQNDALVLLFVFHTCFPFESLFEAMLFEGSLPCALLFDDAFRNFDPDKIICHGRCLEARVGFYSYL